MKLFNIDYLKNRIQNLDIAIDQVKRLPRGRNEEARYCNERRLINLENKKSVWLSRLKFAIKDKEQMDFKF